MDPYSPQQDIPRVVCKWLIVCHFALLLAACTSNPPVKAAGDVSVRVAVTPRALLNAGNRLGIDFSHLRFANQTKCYDDPFQHYDSKNVSFRSICYQTTSNSTTDIYWMRSRMDIATFVKMNSEAVARQLSQSSVSVQLLQAVDGIYYHRVQIGNSFDAVEGTFAIRTTAAADLGLATVVSFRGFYRMTLDEVMQKTSELKGSLVDQ